MRARDPLSSIYRGSARNVAAGQSHAPSRRSSARRRGEPGCGRFRPSRGGAPGSPSRSTSVPCELLRGEVGLEENAGGSGLDHDFSIAALVIVGGLGERDQHGGLAGGGEFGDGGGAAAREDEVGGGEAAGHVVEEGGELPSDPAGLRWPGRRPGLLRRGGLRPGAGG